MPDLLIAPRCASHLDRVVEALRLVHESDRYPTAWPDDPTAWLTPDGALAAWIALADGEVVGHVMLVEGGKVDFAAELAQAAGVPVTGLAGVSRLFVTPEARGTGIAAALVECVEDTPARRGRRLALDVVDDGGPAVHLYERLGWVRVATGPASWTGPDGVRPQAAAYLSPRWTLRAPSHGARWSSLHSQPTPSATSSGVRSAAPTASCSRSECRAAWDPWWPGRSPG